MFNFWVNDDGEPVLCIMMDRAFNLFMKGWFKNGNS